MTLLLRKGRGERNLPISTIAPNDCCCVPNVLNECGSSHNFIDRALDRHSFGKSENYLHEDLPFLHFPEGEESAGLPRNANIRVKETARTTLLAIVQRLTAINLAALNVRLVRTVLIKFKRKRCLLVRVQRRPIFSAINRTARFRGACASRREYAPSHVTRSLSL